MSENVRNRLAEAVTEEQKVHENAGLSTRFGGYETPSPDLYQEVFSSGLVVLDTSALLNLYRYTPSARQDFVQAMSAVGDGLWIPHQVASEFWANRETVVSEAQFSSRHLVDLLTQLQQKAEDEIRNWARRIALSTDHVGELEKEFSQAVENIQRKILRHSARNDLSNASDTGHDPVLSELQRVLVDKVGPPLSSVDFQAALAEAERRNSEEIPPGFRDKAKRGGRGLGDYIVWEQTIRESKRRDADVLFVTSDVKDDWWRMWKGELRGPRIELFDELRQRTGRRLLLARPDTFLRYTNISASSESVNNVMAVEQIETEDGQNTDAFIRARRVMESYLAHLVDNGITSLPVVQDEYGAFVAEVNGKRYYFQFQSARVSLRIDILSAVERAEQRNRAEGSVIVFDDTPGNAAMSLLDRSGVSATWPASGGGYSGNAYAAEKGLFAREGA